MSSSLAVAALALLVALAGCAAARPESPLGVRARAQAFEESSLDAALRGDFASAARLEERALATYRSVDDAGAAAASLNRLGNLRQQGGDLGGAELAYAEARELARQCGAAGEAAAAESNLGTLREREGNREAARSHYEAALRLAREADARAIEASAENNLALLLLEQGALDEARERLEAALEIDQSLGDLTGEATRWRNLGALHRAEGKGQDAIEAFERAHAIDRRREDMPAIALDLVVLSESRAALGRDLARAVNERRRALDVHRALGETRAMARDASAIAAWCARLAPERAPLPLECRDDLRSSIPED